MRSLGSFDLLKKYQIPVPNSIFVHNFDEANISLHETKITCTVFLRGESKNLDSNIKDDNQPNNVFFKLNSNAKTNKISLDNILTIRLDEIFTKIYKDSYSHLTSNDPNAILVYLKKQILDGLDGYKNLPTKDINFITEVIISLGKMMAENQQIAKFNLNPLITFKEGGFAVDVNYNERPGKKNCTLKKLKKKKIPKDFFECDTISIVEVAENTQKIGNVIFYNTVSGDRQVFNSNNSRDILDKKDFPNLTSTIGNINKICFLGGVVDIIKDCCLIEVEVEGKKIISGGDIESLGSNCMGFITPEYDFYLDFAIEKFIKENVGLIFNNLGAKCCAQNIGFAFSFENQSNKPIIWIKSEVLESSCNTIFTHTETTFYNKEVFGKNIFDAFSISSITNAIKGACLLSKNEHKHHEKSVAFYDFRGLRLRFNELLGAKQCSLTKLDERLNYRFTNVFTKINHHNNPKDILGEFNLERLKNFFKVLDHDENFDPIVFVGALYTLYDFSVEDIIAFNKSCSKNMLICLQDEHAFVEQLNKEDIFIFTSLESFLPVLSVLLEMQNGKFKKE